MKQTILMAKGTSGFATVDDTPVNTELQLGGVVLSQREVPLIHRVELYPYFSTTPAAKMYAMGLISKEAFTSVPEPFDDDWISGMLIDIDESGGGYRLIGPYVQEFAIPISIASSSLYITACCEEATTYHFKCHARVFYSVQKVTANDMVALLAS